MQENKFLIPGAIVVAGLLVAAAIFFGGSTPASVATSNDDTAPEVNIDKVTAADHIRGNADAKVTIVEYSDTECPFCKVFHNTLKQVVADYGGKVSWVYRHFPLYKSYNDQPPLHAKAGKEAEATECAAELGGKDAFWSYLDEIFSRTNSNDTLDPLELPRIAGAIGLNVTTFNECLNSGKYAEFVSESVEKAIDDGARGTPYSVIVAGDKQVVVNGAESLAAVKSKIDALLK